MNVLRFTLVVIVSFFSFCASSQSTINETNIQKYNTLSQELDGYYQIQVINSRAFPTVSFELLKEIKLKRELTKNSFVFVRKDIRVFVLGKTAQPKYLSKASKLIYLSE